MERERVCERGRERTDYADHFSYGNGELGYGSDGRDGDWHVVMNKKQRNITENLGKKKGYS